jgi:hypothetical protein
MYKDSAKKKEQHHNMGSLSELNVDMESLYLSQEIITPALESGGDKDKKCRSQIESFPIKI